MKKLSTYFLLGVMLISSVILPNTALADCSVTTNTGGSTMFEVVGFSAGTVWGATKFTTTCAGSVSTVSIKLNAQGTPPNFIAALYTDNSGTPGTIIGSFSGNTSISGATCGTGIVFTLPSPAVADATLYWIILKTFDDSSSAVNYTYWCGDSGGTPFRSSINGSIWTGSDTGTAMTVNITSAASPIKARPLSRAFWWI